MESSTTPLRERPSREGSATSAPERASGWRTWTSRRRALASLTVGLWAATAVCAAVGVMLEDRWVLALALPLLALEWWVSDRWMDAELAEGALDGVVPDSPEMLELRHELGELSEREQSMLLADKMLDDDEAVMALRYPSRESLVLRQASEAVELLGLALVVLGWPVVWLAGLGVFLWIAGGRSGELVIRSLLDRRLYRTPISSEDRGRRMRLEERAVPAICAVLLVVVIVRFVA